MNAKEIKQILENEGAVYMINQLFIDLVKENDPEKRHDIHKHNWDNILDALKSYATQSLPSQISDEEIEIKAIRVTIDELNSPKHLDHTILGNVPPIDSK